MIPREPRDLKAPQRLHAHRAFDEERVNVNGRAAFRRSLEPCDGTREILIEAAAQRDDIAAVVSEGAGERVGEVDASGVQRILLAAPMAVMTASMTVFQNHGAPPPIVERIGLIAPRPFFLIYAGGCMERRQWTFGDR